MKFEDIYTIKLPDKYASEFCTRLGDEYNLMPILNFDDVKSVVNWALENAYKDTARYILADNLRDKAIAAYEGAPDKAKAKILAIWLKVVDGMPKVERAMAGIDL